MYTYVGPIDNKNKTESQTSCIAGLSFCIGFKKLRSLVCFLAYYLSTLIKIISGWAMVIHGPMVQPNTDQ